MASRVVMRTAMRVDVRRMISSAGIYLHKVLFFMEAFMANQPKTGTETSEHYCQPNVYIS